jgi:hypothetical protein
MTQSKNTTIKKTIEQVYNNWEFENQELRKKESESSIYLGFRVRGEEELMIGFGLLSLL